MEVYCHSILITSEALRSKNSLLHKPLNCLKLSKMLEHYHGKFKCTTCKNNQTVIFLRTRNLYEWLEIFHLHFPVIEKHAIHFLYGSFSCLLSLKMHKAVAFGAIFITHHL